MNLKIFLLITLSFELAVTKKYKICEFAKEIYEKHNVTRSDIFKHICIAAVSLDTQSDGTLVGIYGIGREWWCGEKEPSGGCNLECSKFLDDDISDDAACAKKILSQQGLDAWDETEEDCLEEHRHYVAECLTIIDAINETVSKDLSTTTSTTPNTVAGEMSTTNNLLNVT